MIEANRSSARRLVQDALNGRHADAWNDVLADRFVTHMPGIPPGADREAIRGLYERMADAFPDLRYEIEAEVAQHEKVMYRLRATGTHRREFHGVDGSGKTASWDELHLFQFGTDGRIVEHWGLVDSATLMMQLGLMPPVERW